MSFEDDSDADLLQYMAMQSLPGSQEAWGIFFVRHRQSLFDLVSRAHGWRFRDEHELADVVAETFRRAYIKAHQFKGTGDLNAQRRQVVAWLCRIAENIIKDLLRQRARLPTIEIPEEELAAPEPCEERLTASAEAVKALLDGLPAGDRMILLETMEWWNRNKRQSQMPRGVLKELADRLGTTAANIRQKRLRLLARLEERLTMNVNR